MLLKCELMLLKCQINLNTKKGFLQPTNYLERVLKCSYLVLIALAHTLISLVHTLIALAHLNSSEKLLRLNYIGMQWRRLMSIFSCAHIMLYILKF